MKSNVRWKKRTIAQTTRLQKYNAFVSLGSFLAFVLISLYPTINYAINSGYIREIKTMLSELSTVHMLRGHSMFAKSMVYMRISSNIQNDDTISGIIDEYLPTLYAKNAETVLDLKNMLSNFSDETRYDYEAQKKFIYGSLSGNMCEQFRDFRKLNLDYEKKRSDYLDPDLCYETFGPLLPRGVIISKHLIKKSYLNLI